MGIRMVEEALRGVFAAGWDVRGRLPVALDEDSEPEPDISVVPGSFRDYQHGHPPRAGLADYWIVNLVDHVLDVYRVRRPTPARRMAGAMPRRSRSARATW